MVASSAPESWSRPSSATFSTSCRVIAIGRTSAERRKQSSARNRQRLPAESVNYLAFALAAGFCDTLNGAARTTFVTAPLLRHLVQTLIALLPFGVVTFTRCRFGLNFRRVIPVIFVPTPPRYFFLPRVVT